MERKHVRINIVTFLAFLALVQLMLTGKALGCGTTGEGCGLFNPCCSGYECSDPLKGGSCSEVQGRKSCTYDGDCGFLEARCCGKLKCSKNLSGGRCE